MPARRPPNRPGRTTPDQGGRLITRTSSEVPGFANYTWKHDWRRDLTDEMRREGDDYFRPNLDIPVGNQPFPQLGEAVIRAINLVHYVRRPNGKAALIVGTKTTLYRYFAFDSGDYTVSDLDPAYFAEDYVSEDYVVESATPEGYFAEDYMASDPGGWQIIGTGFSELGHRWEALNINGYAVFNNGVDLPVTYRVEEDTVMPIYELREVGIAFVGTIWENNGILMAGDIGQMKEEGFAANFQHINSGAVLGKQYGSRSGNPLTATRQAGTTLRTADAASFVQTPPSASLNSWTGLTVEAMVRFANPADGGSIAAAIASPVIGFVFALQSNVLSLSINSNAQSLSTPFYQTGWTHVAATTDGTTAKLYVNGFLVASGVMGLPVVTLPDLFSVVGGSAAANFDMAYLRVWNIARTQPEISAGMAEDVTVTANLKIWHKLDEGAGTTVADASGNANTGTLTGAPLPTWVAASAPSDSFVLSSGVFFTAGMVGKFLTFTNGLTVRIIAFVSTTVVKVSASVDSLTGLNLPFTLHSTSTAVLTGTVTRTAATATLAGTGTAFLTELSVGQLIRVPNGSGEEVRKVTVITSNILLTVDSNWVANGGGGATAAHRVSDFTVLASAAIFAATDVGRAIYWPDGSARIITAFQNDRRVDVDSHMAINEGAFDLENQTAYDAITNENQYDRIQYRSIWGAIDEPRVWNATVPVTIAAGSRTVTSDYPIRSSAVGEQVTILGAGTLGASFTATVLLVAPDGRTLILDMAAITSVEDALMQRTSSIGSVSGFHDLQDDDSSAIIAGLDLRGRTIIYKDTSIFLCDFTGNVAQPFNFQRIYQGDDTLHYKYTLCNPQGTYHLYAGQTGFFFFDLTSQVPQRAEMFDYVENLFYPVVTIERTDEIFAGQCGPTKEVFIMFPGGVDGVQGIAFDHKYRTLSTLGAAYTAVATVKKPMAGIPIGVQEDWCVCGDGAGTVILYGKANGPQAQWGGKQAMWSRRGSSYTSRLRGGLFGGGWGELDITGYLPEVSSQGRPNTTPITVNLYKYRNPAEAARLCFSRVVQLPDQNNLIPAFFRANYFQDEIVVSGVNNPFRLAARSIKVGSVNSDGTPRRP